MRLPLPGESVRKEEIMVAARQKTSKKKSPSSKPKAKKKDSDSSESKNANHIKTIATLVTMVKDLISIAISIKSLLP